MMECIAYCINAAMALGLGVMWWKLDEARVERDAALARLFEARLDCGFGELLGRPAWMPESGGGWRKKRVVAVSWKGSVALRDWDDLSGKHARWVGRDSGVRFKEPEDAL